MIGNQPHHIRGASRRVSLLLVLAFGCTYLAAVPALACSIEDGTCTRVATPPIFTDTVDPLGIGSVTGSISLGEMPAAEAPDFVVQSMTGGQATEESTTASCSNEWGARFYHKGWYNDGAGRIKYDHGLAQRTKGCASYKVTVHSTLQRLAFVDSAGDKNYDVVWGAFGAEDSDPCAQDTEAGTTAQSCSSPWKEANAGEEWKWGAGFGYDYKNNNSWDWTCPGCIDMHHTFRS